jgi:hypothetical protein
MYQIACGNILSIKVSSIANTYTDSVQRALPKHRQGPKRQVEQIVG